MIRLLRDYQLDAVHALKAAAAKGKDRFPLEMARGTGKTLWSAAIAKLYLRTENASRILFLVDRVELEKQAKRNFRHYLANDESKPSFTNSDRMTGSRRRSL